MTAIEAPISPADKKNLAAAVLVFCNNSTYATPDAVKLILLLESYLISDFHYRAFTLLARSVRIGEVGWLGKKARTK